MGREWHVSKKGSDKANGSLESPFLTISKAANLALAGDRVIVHEGIYREDVDPRHGSLHRYMYFHHQPHSTIYIMYPPDSLSPLIS